MDGDFFGPLEYSGWFPWAAFGLLVLVAVWYAYVFRSTRRRPGGQQAVQAPAPPAVAVPDLARLRRDYLERIDAVDREAAAGTRSGRSAHQELSLLIRSFVRDASGVDATRMTLAELRAAGRVTAVVPASGVGAAGPAAPGIPAAADAIAALYPAAFAAGPASGAADAARTAREVVRSWN
ncbi:hypothetical protein J2W14_002468 [Pseudarthrobacter oxydans]|uniref:hypothetical protein n=1 Tax=Pseudarthrobacter oxydans TaxID=1671 RepID=UPI00278BA950|nr:hypothetical protein [Pseudarthrobacter oxydans]MDP9983066.1 hypothetical protein [Pseudarthrobacter oxydans]